MDNFSVHISKFSTESEASLREAPHLEVSRKLINQFSSDGFLSSSEPVLTRFIDSWFFYVSMLCFSSNSKI